MVPFNVTLCDVTYRIDSLAGIIMPTQIGYYFPGSQVTP